MTTLILRDTIANEHFELDSIELDIGVADFAPVMSPVVCVAGDLDAYKEGLIVGLVTGEEGSMDGFEGYALPFKKTDQGFVMMEAQLTQPHDTRQGAAVEVDSIVYSFYDPHSAISPRGSVTIRV